MNNTVITAIVVAIVFGGGGYYVGSMTSKSSATASPNGTAFAGRTGGAGRFGGGAAGGGFTGGTILSIGNGTMTIQMAASTSTSATTGTKIVLFDTTTQVSEMQTVAPSALTVGQSVTVTGATNSDGSVTATSIQVRPARTGGLERPATTPTTGQ